MKRSLAYFEAQFRATLGSFNLHPPQVVADGTLHRFDAEDDSKGKKSAWYVLHNGNVPAGAFGNWKTGLSEKWRADSEHDPAFMGSKQYGKQLAKISYEIANERAKLQRDAQSECRRIFESASEATDDNPYCLRKGIKPYGLKEFRNNRTLLVPLIDSVGGMRSLQFIKADGTKKFKSGGRTTGCYYAFGGEPTSTLLLCEGFATGASLFEATNYPVAVAFSAQNLVDVARTLRFEWPQVRIVICADNDRFSRVRNVGIESASAAARAVSGYLAIPHFPSTDSTSTDFNDLWRPRITRVSA